MMMGEFEHDKEVLVSKVVKAGRRTYFLDVKEMRSGDRYLTITESKRRFSDELGKFVYDKHKVFLYPEDFEKFSDALGEVIRFVQTGELPSQEPNVHSVDDEVDFDSL